MGKIKGNDCCCSDWKSIIKELWANYQSMVRSIMMGGREYHPDGNGQITLPLPELVNGIALYDMSDYWSLFTANDDIMKLTHNITYWTMEVTHS